MTPFQKAGYTLDTKFKVVQDYGNLRAGDIVTIRSYNDMVNDYDYYPIFTTEDGREEAMHLPVFSAGVGELEVLVDPEKEDAIPVSISMTLEEGIALQVLLDNVLIAGPHGHLLRIVGEKLDNELEGKVKEVSEWDYYDLGDGYDLSPQSGSFEALLKAMLPKAKAEDLRKQLEALEKQIAEMGA